MANTEREMIKT